MKFADFLAKREIFENCPPNQQPRLSIVMPTHRDHAEGLLRPCIESVLRQSFNNFEFIILGDGSTDGLEAVIRSYCGIDPRIRYVRHPEECGLSAVRMNEGILLSRAPFISFILDNNTWKLDALDWLMGAIEASGADMVYGNQVREMEGGKNQIMGNFPPTFELLQNFNYIPGGSVLCRRFFFEQYGLFDPHLLIRGVYDWDLWLRAMKQGANVHHINRILGKEHGSRAKCSCDSRNHRGDKACIAYIQDETRLAIRSKALRPENIMDYDIFNYERALPYVRDWKEWDRLEETIYSPYLERHPHVLLDPIIRDNRRHDPAQYGYALNATHAIFRDRKRFLLVANRYDRTVQDWWQALSQDRNNILVSCNEIGISAYSPEDLDGIVLFDCTMTTLDPILQTHKESAIPIAYIIVHGIDDALFGTNDLLYGLNLTQDEAIREYFGKTVYFSRPGTPWSPVLEPSLKQVTDLADQVFLMGGLKSDKTSLQLKVSLIKFIPNALDAAAGQPETMEIALYLGVPKFLSRGEEEAIIRWLERTPATGIWKVYSLSELLPERLGLYSKKMQIIRTYDSLPSLVRKLKNTLFLVPDGILRRFSEYHMSILEEDLARNNSCLEAGIAGRNPPDNVTLELFCQKVASLQTKLAGQDVGFLPNARYLQFQNVLRGVSLRKRITILRNRSRASDLKTMVFINSQALAGSEAYGLMLTKALSEVGFEIQLCTHASFDPFPEGIDHLNDWLGNRGLPPIVKAEYGKVSRAMLLPTVPEQDLQQYSDNLCRWLDEQKIGLVVCSGFISEPVIGRSDGRLVYMALFQPWDYCLRRMGYLRNRVAGVLSDTQWAADLWARWMAPPVACIPSMVEAENFITRNQDLPTNPICIAIAGTFQPRKRQREAIKAVQTLLAEGWDLRLNLYGYEFSGLNQYIQEIKRLAEDPLLEGRVIFHGFLADFSKICRDNHIILSSSSDESLPQGMIFAMASGLLAVCCPAGGIPEMVQDGVTGFLAKGFNVQDISGVLRRALKSRDRWPETIRAARELILKRCSEQIFTHQILKMMERGADISLLEGCKYFRMPRAEG